MQSLARVQAVADQLWSEVADLLLSHDHDTVDGLLRLMREPDPDLSVLTDDQARLAAALTITAAVECRARQLAREAEDADDSDLPAL